MMMLLIYFAQAEEDIKKVFAEGEKQLKPNPLWIFEDVYSSLPPHLQKQKKQLWSHLSKYQNEYPELESCEHDKNDLQQQIIIMQKQLACS